MPYSNTNALNPGYTLPPVERDSNFYANAKPVGKYNPTYEPPIPMATGPSKAEVANIGMGAATIGVGLATGGTGWLIMGGIQLLGGLLSAFTRQKPLRSPMEIEFENMVSFYRRIGARSAAARAVVSAVTGKPVASLSHIGVDDNTALDMTVNRFDKTRARTAEKVTGGTR